MNEVDWVILAVLALSIGVGVLRGVVREILAIVGWVVGALLAMRFSVEIGNIIPLPSLAPVIRTVLAAIAVVVVTLFVFGLAGRIIGRLLAAARITFEDRMMGAVFGLLRGVVIVCVCVFVLSMTSAVRTGPWRNSLLVVPAERIIDVVIPYFPAEVGALRQHYRVF